MRREEEEAERSGVLSIWARDDRAYVWKVGWYRLVLYSKLASVIFQSETATIWAKAESGGGAIQPHNPSKEEHGGKKVAVMSRATYCSGVA